MNDRIMCVQLKTGYDTDAGPSWIGWVRFTKTQGSRCGLGVEPPGKLFGRWRTALDDERLRLLGKNQPDISMADVYVVRRLDASVEWGQSMSSRFRVPLDSPRLYGP